MATTLFVDVNSDEDSIKTDYTTEDPEDTFYDIETILLHEESTDEYLIKWAGYPLGEATWEPRSGLPDDSSEVWTQWTQHLDAVRQGTEFKFDFEEYQRLWIKHREAKNARRARRNAKRRKRNLPTKPDTIEQEQQAEIDANDAQSADDEAAGEEDDSDDEPLVARRVRSRSNVQQQLRVGRKGVAQKIKRQRVGQSGDTSSSDESSDSSNASSGGDSLQDELVAKNAMDAKRKRKLSAADSTSFTKPARKAARDEVGKRRAHPLATSSTAKEQPSEPERRPKPNGAERPAPGRITSTSKPPQSQVGRKQGPSNATPDSQKARAKKSGNVMSNWGVDKQKRRRVPTADALSTETGDYHHFYNLKMQNSVSKFTLREAAPEFSALNVVDPKTGKVTKTSRVADSTVSSGQEKAANADSTAGRGTVPSAYARRSPPLDSRRKGSSPFRGDDIPTAAAVPDNAAARQPSDATNLTAVADPRRENFPKMVCRGWLEGNCRYTAQDCFYAHFYLNGDETKMKGEDAAQLRIPPRDWLYDANKLLCHYLRLHGRCRQGHNCKFAHHDTGYDAPPPKVSIEDVRACQAAYARRLASSTGPPDTNAGAPWATASEAPRHWSRDIDVVRIADDGSSLPPKRLTCHFWRTRNSCTKGERCEYAHWDTGLDAAPPGGFKRKAQLALNANTTPLGSHWRPASRLSGGPVFDETISSVPTKPLPLQTDVRDSGNIMSPGTLTASPTHVAWSEATGADSPLRSRAIGSNDLITKSGIVKMYHQGGERPHIVRARFEVLGERAFTRLVGENPVLQIQEAILVSDIQAILGKTLKHSPETAAGFLHLDVADEHEMSGLAELCKLHKCGLFASVEGHSAQILVYPSSDERWRYLTPDLPLGSGASLGMCVFTSCPDVRGSTKSAATLNGMNMHPSGTTYGQLLTQLDPGGVLPKDSNAVFLMMPPAHAAELEVYRQVFSGLKWNVYEPGTPGAWAYFRKKHAKSGVVLIHPSVPLSQVPGLHDSVSGTSVAFFLTGGDGASDFSQPREAVHQCSRILAQGAAILLTDDLIFYHTDEATRIIQNFLDANVIKPEGGENNKIVARPGLKRFLLEQVERGRPDDRWLRLYGAVCDLCPAEDEEGDSNNPSSASHLVSIDPDLLPSYAGSWEREEVAATDLLVDWFAGWAEINASNFRRFYVCHQPKDTLTKTAIDEMGKEDARSDADPRSWAKKYQHIGVLPPNKLIEKVYKRTDPHKSVRRWISQ